MNHRSLFHLKYQALAVYHQRSGPYLLVDPADLQVDPAVPMEAHLAGPAGLLADLQVEQEVQSVEREGLQVVLVVHLAE